MNIKRQHTYKVRRKHGKTISPKNRVMKIKLSLTLEEAANYTREAVHMYICGECGFIHISSYVCIIDGRTKARTP